LDFVGDATQVPSLSIQTKRAEIVIVQNNDPLCLGVPGCSRLEAVGFLPLEEESRGKMAIRQQGQDIFGCDPVDWGDRCARPLTILAFWGKLGV
jgi:hypothetical protein